MLIDSCAPLPNIGVGVVASTKSLAPSENVSRETRERLSAFVELLLQWNRTINLVSRKDEADIWQRHVEDSLSLLPHIPLDTSHAIDLGSGGGFPGIVLAIATAVPFHLVESDHRKAAFLREAVRHTAANAQVHAMRAEQVRLPKAPLITARALAPLPQLLTWASPLLQQTGFCLFHKGRTVAEELTLAAPQWHMQVQAIDSFGGSTILRISEIARVEHRA